MLQPPALARSPEARSLVTIAKLSNFYICKIQTHRAVASERICAWMQLRASLETSLALRQSNYSFSGSPASTFWRQDDLSHTRHISTLLYWQLLLSRCNHCKIQNSICILYQTYRILIFVRPVWVSKEYACVALMTSKNSCRKSKPKHSPEKT